MEKQILDELKKQTEVLERMEKALMRNLNIKKQKLVGRSEDYEKFENWGRDMKFFSTQQVSGKFKVTKMTALTWMSQFVFDNDDYDIKQGSGNEPQRVFKKPKK